MHSIRSNHYPLILYILGFVNFQINILSNSFSLLYYITFQVPPMNLNDPIYIQNISTQNIHIRLKLQSFHKNWNQYFYFSKSHKA